MSEIWFTSDTHFGHVRIAEFCSTRIDQFDMKDAADVQKMNEMIVLQWNSQVAPDDKVFHFGDLAMGNIENSLSYVARLNGDLHLILGNHDRPHPSYSRTDEKRERWTKAYAEAGVKSQAIDGRIDMDGIPCIMSHFPYGGDHTEFDRYPEYRPADNGQVLIHGHVHDMWQVNGRQINVGMDAHGGRLLHRDEVAEFVREAAGN